MVELGASKTDTIFLNCKKHIQSWVDIPNENFDIRRLSGMSNEVYKVNLKDTESDVEPKAILYRIFLTEINDKELESTIFNSMSEKGFGPKLFFRNTEYRIESFFEGRPLTIFEMRNPCFMKLAAQLIFQYNFNQDAIEKVKAMKPIDKSQLYLDTRLK